MSTKTCCTGQGPCPVCGGSTKRYVRSQFDDDYDPKLPDGYIPMTTPDPIATAREALNRLWDDGNETRHAPKRGDWREVTAALDYAEKLKAEDEILHSANAEFSRAAIESHAEVLRLRAEIEKLKAENERIRTEAFRHLANYEGAANERDRLTSQLEQAESSALKHLSELVKISERLGGTSTPAPGYALGLVNQLAEELECPGPKSSSQWIKDRQAKGGAS